MTVEKSSFSWLHETKIGKNPVRENEQNYRPCVRINNSRLCVRMSQQWREWRSGENGESTWSDGGVGFLANMRVNLLVECACGQGLIVLPPSTPSHNCPN